MPVCDNDAGSSGAFVKSAALSAIISMQNLSQTPSLIDPRIRSQRHSARLNASATPPTRMKLVAQTA
jgi:hypothetical protein